MLTDLIKTKTHNVLHFCHKFLDFSEKLIKDVNRSDQDTRHNVDHFSHKFLDFSVKLIKDVNRSDQEKKT